MECFVLHEDHVAYFETLDEILDGGTKIATTGPNILNVGDVIGLDPECFCEPSVIKLKALIFKKLIVARVVKNLLSQHDEARVVSTCQANIVQVIETGTKLGTDQGVSWWVKLSSHTVGLEAKDARCNKVDVITPSCDDGISFNRGAWYTCGRKTFFVTLPGLSKSHLLAFADTVTDKTIFTSAARRELINFRGTYFESPQVSAFSVRRQ
jgi:hypothetical protein